jgi:hypothetical protein
MEALANDLYAPSGTLSGMLAERHSKHKIQCDYAGGDLGRGAHWSAEVW